MLLALARKAGGACKSATHDGEEEDILGCFWMRKEKKKYIYCHVPAQEEKMAGEIDGDERRGIGDA